MRQIKRKSLMIIMALMLMIPCLFSMKVHAADGKLIIAMETDLAKGDTVTVTLMAKDSEDERAIADMTFTYDKDVFQFVSADSDSYHLEEEGILHFYETTYVDIKMNVVGSGETVLKVTGSNGSVRETGIPLNDMEAAGVPLTVKGGSGSNTLSNDNSLTGITLSQGVLSPEFSAATREYTATVPYETTSLEVTALTSSTVATTTITGAEELAVGENIITIAVKAENGDTVNYTILVTREEESAGTATTPGDAEDDGVIEEYQQQITNLLDKYDQLQEQMQQQKAASKRIVVVLIVVIVILVVLCFGLILFNFQKGKEEEDDDFGFDKEDEPMEEENDWLDDDDEEESDDMEMIDFDKLD